MNVNVVRLDRLVTIGNGERALLVFDDGTKATVIGKDLDAMYKNVYRALCQKALDSKVEDVSKWIRTQLNKLGA